MRSAVNAHDALAALLEYPREGYSENAAAWIDTVTRVCPEAGAALAPLAVAAKTLPLWRCEELFTRTFDLNPVCSLEIGWQLYGEQYARGAFLVSAREKLRKYGVPESTELPDHMTCLLRLLGRMEADPATDLALRRMKPALDRMLAKFKGTDNPYAGVLDAVNSFLSFYEAAALVAALEGGDA